MVNGVWRLLKKLKIELPYGLALALLSIYTKDLISYNRNAGTSMFIAVNSK